MFITLSLFFEPKLQDIKSSAFNINSDSSGPSFFLIFNCSPSAVSFSFEISLAFSAVVTVSVWLKTVILHLNYCNNLRTLFSASSPVLITMHGSGEGCQPNELPDVLFSAHPSPAAGTFVSSVCPVAAIGCL